MQQRGVTCVDDALSMSRGQNPSLRFALTTSGWLLGINGAHLGEDLRLYPGINTVGAAARCHIVVTAPEIGRQHAVIDCVSAESAILSPGTSDRPLYHNNQLCTDPVTLHHGDTIQVGEQYFAYVSLLPERNSSEEATILLKERPKHLALTAGWLIELKGNAEGRDFRLIAGENRIGSQAGLEVCLADSKIKPRHCILTRHQANWTIIPLSIKDNIRINGIPSTGRGIDNGDIVSIGNHEFIFRCIKVALEK